MSIKLRKRSISNGRYSLFLDYCRNVGRQYEFLKLYTYQRPKTDEERKHNKEAYRFAESIRAKREFQISASENGVELPFKKNINFIEYFTQYAARYNKKNVRGMEGSLRYFKAFIGKETLSARELTEQLCVDFKEYLNEHLHGETPYDYFAHFKRVLKQATREKILPVNPAAEVVNRKVAGKDKEMLLMDEIQTLASAPCGNAEVRRAFLFACFTGLRYCDIKALKWKHIQNGELNVTQSKTQVPVTVKLKPTAQQLLGVPIQEEQLVFVLPSHTAILKCLRAWAKKAGLQKHVTFHCARYSFATNLIIHEADISIVSRLLGHTSLNHTQKYVRIVEALKQQAIDKLPDINL